MQFGRRLDDDDVTFKETYFGLNNVDVISFVY